jgi:hypothetical protein
LPNFTDWSEELAIQLFSLNLDYFHASGTLLPATIILLGIAYDLITSLPSILAVEKAWKWLTRPFRNFMVLDDLLEPIGPPVKVSNNTYRALSTLSVVSLVEWLGCLAFGIHTDDATRAVHALIFAICWVSNPFPRLAHG